MAGKSSACRQVQKHLRSFSPQSRKGRKVIQHNNGRPAMVILQRMVAGIAACPMPIVISISLRSLRLCGELTFLNRVNYR